MFREASVNEEEFNIFENAQEDYLVYYSQLSEINAREAGETGSLKYIRAINEYLGIELDVDMDTFSGLKEYIDYIQNK